MFDDLTFEELRRRANTPLPEPLATRLRALGERRTVAVDDALYRSDDRNYPFVYALSATVRVCDPTGMVLGEMGPGQFTGDLALLLGQTAFADCIVIAPGEVQVIPQTEITELAQVDPEISDLLLEAFAARRLIQIQRQQETLLLVGSQSGPALRRVLVYADRNRIPYRCLDPSDPADRARIPAIAAGGDGARVVVRGRHVLAEPSVSEVARALGLDLTVSNHDVADLIIVGAGPAGLSAAVYGAAVSGLRTILLDDAGDRRPGGGVLADRELPRLSDRPLGRRSRLPRRAAGGEVRRTRGNPTSRREARHRSEFGPLRDHPRRRRLPPRPRRGDRHRRPLPQAGRGRRGPVPGRRPLLCRHRARGALGYKDTPRWWSLAAATRPARPPCSWPPAPPACGWSAAATWRKRCRAISSSGCAMPTTSRSRQALKSWASPAINAWPRFEFKDADGRVVSERSACGLFVMIGADPCTGWLGDAVRLDDRGFVLTGTACGDDAPEAPFNIFQTTAPGVFGGHGDVRSVSVQRASSTGRRRLGRGAGDPHPAGGAAGG